MKDCLCTIYNDSIQNDSLLRVGELKIVQSNVEDKSVPQELTIRSGSNFSVRITGDAYFTNNTLSTNLGKVMQCNGNTSYKLYLSTSDCTLFISNKYNLIACTVYSKGRKSLHANLEDFKYLGNNFTNITLSDTSVKGDLSSLSGLTGLTNIALSDTSVKGDLSSLSGLTGLTNIALSDTSVKGDLSSLSGLVNVKTILFSELPIQGNISSLKKLDSLLEFWSSIALLSGDLATLPSNITFFKNNNTDSTFTWSNRSSDKTIFGMNNIKFSNVDDVLINLSKCTVPPSVQSSYRALNLIGTRTSASDAAVTTLQSKGYTVSITPA